MSAGVPSHRRPTVRGSGEGEGRGGGGECASGMYLEDDGLKVGIPDAQCLCHFASERTCVKPVE